MDIRISTPDPRVGTLQKPAPTIPSGHTTRYRTIEKRANIIQKEEIDIIAKLTETELTHLFVGLGVTEGQYSF